MATNTERKFLGQAGTERIVAKVKALLSSKQDVGAGTFIDRTTGKKYTLYVDNGNLKMEEAAE